MGSYQQEVPKSRVNITVDVQSGQAKKTLELPLKLLLLGDYSNGGAEGRIAERERIRVDKHNLDAVLASLCPRLQIRVDNTFAKDGSQVGVDLTFDRFEAFGPEAVARAIPQVDNLLAMRNLLKDLRSNVLDNAKFRRELERIVRNQQELAAVRGELMRIAPLESAAWPGGEAAAPDDATATTDPADVADAAAPAGNAAPAGATVAANAANTTAAANTGDAPASADLPASTDILPQSQ
ncbi:type VI secretion system contractile sheath small subunit [Halorhodospira abdelmalekii]|uniref:type VI secretion system contractile sheath small subunit n=1 Tax=Halorhodospira abdelmalekii TaxID=421629 RepID=UPI001906349B|nr:type VI secretion system contractile sheath small subunit [Halorhodospira abdelmalekii]